MRHLIVAASLAAALAGSALADVPGNSVKIGVLSDFSGPFADQAGKGSFIAAQMAAEDFAKESKGLKAEIIFADHQNKPDVGSAIARRWVDQENVAAIVDLPNSGVALAVNTVMKEKNRTMLASGSATSDLTGKFCQPTTVQWALDTWALGNAMGSAITERGGRSWFFVSFDYALGKALQRDTTEAIGKQGGKVLGAVTHPLGTTDFSSYLLQAQASGADVDRARRHRRGRHQRHQADRRVQHPRRQQEARRAVHADRRHRRARAQGLAGPALERGLLLGPQRFHTCLEQAVRGADGRPHADHQPRRDLFGDDCVSARSSGRADHRGRQGGRAD